MSQTVSLALTPQTRDTLRRIADDRRRPLAHVLRARVVLLSDERLPVPRRRHQEFIAFLDQVEEAVPAGKSLPPRRRG